MPDRDDGNRATREGWARAAATVAAHGRSDEDEVWLEAPLSADADATIVWNDDFPSDARIVTSGAYGGATPSKRVGNGVNRPTATPPPTAARGFRDLIEDRRGLLDADRYEAPVVAVADAIVAAFRGGHKVFWFGNGGSAADAQHLAAEFSGRFLRERRGLPSESFTVNTSALTAISNDYGFERVFARQVEAFVTAGDVVVGLSTTGNSKNVTIAMDEARALGATTIAFTGNGGGKMLAAADIAIVGPDGYSALVQEIHITLGHIVCDLVESQMFPSNA